MSSSPTDRALDPALAAHDAELRYVHDDERGWKRVGRPRSFDYVDDRGRRIRDRRALARIAALAIPPAWTTVWICASPDGHIQATGRDARGRKQYRYHARWRVVRDEAKYELVLAFGEALPALRRRIAHDLGTHGLSRDKVVATVLRIMERTCIRVGNDCYAEANHSFGLTTLRDRHARISGGDVTFAFTGKSGKVHHVALHDQKLASIVKRCRDIPGQRLFQWIDDTGARHPITSNDVNDYIRRATDGPYSAKMMRTWMGTVSASRLLRDAQPCASARAGKRVIADCLEKVAAHLGNTPAISRKSYVHPVLFRDYTAGSFHDSMRRAMARSRRDPSRWMTPDERALLSFFRAHEQTGALALAA
jgi:DNA topoisomerase-1